jgi:phosphatidylglycerol---prolipoprotein diacylglyceryl transferase
MSLLALPFPNFDPVALQLGPFAIKWYGLAYLAGLLLGWLYIRRLLAQPKLWADDQPPFARAKVDDLLLYITVGVVLGGRLGFVFFYEPGYYLANPQDIIAVWKGGMAFHGALVGCAIAIWIFAWRNAVNPWSTADLCTAAVPIGLFFGRIANFINGELFGRPTSLPWGMVFPEARLHYPQVEPTPRHPSQLYEAAMEGLILFIVLRILTHYFGALKRPGLVSGTFLVGYALARSISEEFFRQPHFGHAFNVGPLTVGTVYSIPMLIAGVIVIYLARTRELR